QGWTDTIYELKPSKSESVITSDSHPVLLTPHPPQFTRYVAPGGITAVAKFLATGLEIWFNRRVQM
ncbi:MAG TPA: FAD-dependent oxidoreductase, partial [Cyanobacteria bacterium UBA8543]|nr:FAD-dependent oxidoreductase [Cyanobacteria bacterium UBA8543]